MERYERTLNAWVDRRSQLKNVAYRVILAAWHTVKENTCETHKGHGLASRRRKSGTGETQQSCWTVTPPCDIEMVYTRPCTVVQSRRMFTTKKALVVSSMSCWVASSTPLFAMGAIWVLGPVWESGRLNNSVPFNFTANPKLLYKYGLLKFRGGEPPNKAFRRSCHILV